ncbi:MAG TPA: hemerythrin domain-containing protein [Acidiferrobacter sp.]|nr:hemerythrin domain-containing protein [Acidiferrobacter sp.]
MRIAERGEGVGGPGFDDPLGLLAACHERITDHCETLGRLRAHVQAHGFDDDAQVAAGRLQHYFAEAGRWHHEDEEQDLAPLFYRHAEGAQRTVFARLMAEHRALEAAYAPLAEALRALDPRPHDLPIEPYVTLIRAHIAAENAHILPAARALLGPDEIKQLGQAMAARRGVRQASL